MALRDLTTTVTLGVSNMKKYTFQSLVRTNRKNLPATCVICSDDHPAMYRDK